MRHKQGGFTLIEIAIVLVIIGLLLGGVLKGQELITSARVRNLISTQDGIKAAYFGFVDRYRALPGDYTQAGANINGILVVNPACGNGNGNGNGQIDAGASTESILAWEHLSKSGFLTGGPYTCAAAIGPGTNPLNPYTAPMQLINDGNYGSVGTGLVRHNLKTGNQIPVDLMAELDRKVDDGLPNTGLFQFSSFSVGAPGAPTEGAVAAPSCTSAAGAAAIWNTTNGSTNCGGASIF
jgi:prepilin-type N-terminal cleavage/methylation domain-containing protein